jgi:hypothetical protein
MYYLAYGDESGTFSRRYQAVALVTGAERKLSELSALLHDILGKTGLQEIKFSSINAHSYRIRAVNEFFRTCIASVLKKHIRIDVLTWDIQDSRHAIMGRDNVQNLERMYYKVLTYVAGSWQQQHWKFYPDQNTALDWPTLREVLNNSRLFPSGISQPTLVEIDAENPFLHFETIVPKESHLEPLIQVADLFAGMATFCREEGTNCLNWMNKAQLCFEDMLEAPGIDEASRAKQSKYDVIARFDHACKRHKLGVSLRENKYLTTFDRRNPINFWNYEPQHEFDRAPIG